METKTISIYRGILIGIGCLGALTVLVLMILLGVRTLRRVAAPTQPQTTAAQEETEQTQTAVKVTPTENPLKPEDFAYEGKYLTCLNMPARLGIDVSYWQGDINWEAVSQSEMEFAMIRLGYRGTTEGALAQDSRAIENYEGANAAGLQVGGYFFSQATTPEEAVEEAEYVLEMIRDWNMQMPIVYDWEYGGDDSRTANVTARALTDCTLAFCRTIEAAGYEAMIYFNEHQAQTDMYLDELTEYRFWLAQYEEMLDYPYRVDMWQYTCEGTVPGIDGYVDINLLFAYE